MRVVQVSTSGLQGGAARAAVRLHRALRAAGADSVLLVREETGDEPGAARAPSALARALGSVAAVVDESVRRLHRRGTGAYFTAALLPDAFSAQPRAFGADLVHLHWIGGGFVTPEAVARLGRPTVWTLHDSWAFTGGCHVPGACTRYEERCGACPAIASGRAHDLSRLGWWRKSRAWPAADLTVVCPSHWLAERARRSSLLRDRRVEVIPNAVDTSVFRRLDRGAARARLGLPPSERVLLFSALGGAADPNKGFSLLAGALAALAETGRAAGLRLVVAGAAQVPDPERCRIPVTCLGRLQGDDAVALALSAADVAVVPSLQENFPNAALEAHACAVPVVAFRAGGTPELVLDRVTGALAEPYDVGMLAEALAWVLADPARREGLALAARRRVEAEYSLSIHSARYRALYERILARGDDRAAAPA